MKHPNCPKCKSESVALIAYGYPADMDTYLKGIENGIITYLADAIQAMMIPNGSAMHVTMNLVTFL